MNKPLATALAAAVTTILATTGYLTYQHLTTPSAPTGAITLYDPENAQEVAGSADDVFHGTVLRHTGQRTIAEIPSDLYEVRVGHVFKGRLNGTITLTQPSGEPRLTAGKKYVFATASWHNANNEHAVLSDTRPTPAADLTAPVRGAAEGTAHTIAEYWQHAVAHQVDVTPS
ncbi:hypothetical protein [Streptomyces sp. NPDC006307]|uniref:hypothetical protein n=1 Tax=Streptomyces sp. NPDC006307 TaxID=3156748 RepID=UPI0033BD153F